MGTETEQQAGAGARAAAIVRDESQRGAKLPIGSRGAEFSDLGHVSVLAEKLAIAVGAVKNGMTDVDQRVAISRFAARIVTGMELGLSPAQAVRGIYEVNGRTAMYAETLRGLLLSRGVVPSDDADAMEIGIENEDATKGHRDSWPDDVAGFARIRRVGWKTPKTVRFTVRDAKQAGLWNKSGSPWLTYPKRMLEERAFGLWCRKYAADVTMNLPIVSEATDIPTQAPQRASLPPTDPQAPSLLDAIDESGESAPLDTVECEVVSDGCEGGACSASEPARDAEPQFNEAAIAAAMAELESDATRRAGSDPQAARKLMEEATAGLEMRTRADFDEAATRMRNHPHLGDPADKRGERPGSGGKRRVGPRGLFEGQP